MDTYICAYILTYLRTYKHTCALMYNIIIKGYGSSLTAYLWNIGQNKIKEDDRNKWQWLVPMFQLELYSQTKSEIVP